MRRLLNPLVLLLCGVLLAAAACGSTGKASAGARDKKDAAQAVKTALVEQRGVHRNVEVVGTLWPDDQVVVSAQVEGAVQHIYADVGDAAKAGQILAALDQEELRYQVDRRIADLQKTLTRLALPDENSPLKNPADLPDVKKAAANLFDAEQKYKRAQEMFQHALLPQQDMDTVQSRFNSAKADYDVTLQSVMTLQAQLRSERADLELSRKKLRDSEIRAPFAGFIQERHIAPGQYLRVQAPVMTLVKPDPLRLRVDVPEKLAHWIEPGEAIEAVSESLPGRRFAGKIQRISPAIKEQSRAFMVEALIDNHEHVLKPGAFVKATVSTRRTDDVLLLPATALLYNYGVYKVYAIEAGRLSGREVKLGDQFGDQVEIVSGVKAGEQVALNPETLREGARVR